MNWRPDMTIAVDWDVKNQTKPNQNRTCNQAAEFVEVTVRFYKGRNDVVEQLLN